MLYWAFDHLPVIILTAAVKSSFISTSGFASNGLLSPLLDSGQGRSQP